MWVREGREQWATGERHTALDNSQVQLCSAHRVAPYRVATQRAGGGWVLGGSQLPSLHTFNTSSVNPFLRERYSAEHCMMGRSCPWIFFLTMLVSCFNLLLLSLVPTWPPWVSEINSRGQLTRFFLIWLQLIHQVSPSLGLPL